MVALPLWLGEGLSDPWFVPISVAMMFTPALGAIVVVLHTERPRNLARALGLWPIRPVKRFVGYAALGLIVPIGLVLAALPIGSLFGVYPADLDNFSAFQRQIDTQLAGAGSQEIAVSTGVLVALQLLAIPLGAFLNLIPALGEELGWRGWLLPKLVPLGTIPALAISGLIWGLWHAPLVLLGYNYALAPGWLSLIAMIGMCTVVGSVFAWLRLRSGSVWPAALAHGALNAAAGSYLLFAMAGESIDTTQATILGWTGWIVPLILVAVLFKTSQFTPPARLDRGCDCT